MNLLVDKFNIVYAKFVKRETHGNKLHIKESKTTNLTPNKDYNRPAMGEKI